MASKIRRYVIPGEPMAKPRMTRRDKWAKRPRVVRYRSWCDWLRLHVSTPPPAESVISLNYVAYLSLPKSRRGLNGSLHRAAPDVDNLFKGLADGLYPRGDAAIAAGTMKKVWDAENPRLEVTIVYEADES